MDKNIAPTDSDLSQINQSIAFVELQIRKVVPADTAATGTKLLQVERLSLFENQ